ncbi:MAG: FMN-binding domain-containing protein [Spirochaetes bacterium GWD1_27_9]|nr:MAG: FMN-binding domain-containing protein [Spirochaetes bacterium GWB1_27_13]OHD27045.1 MAG: FMN-binding domain-containing protein [Spirochaetes bacterium GWC1_27_15]OHD29449.1 MAG: FMN-binding domain-containing protein [Spirochaetes bacterium GWD1_27_9]
MKLKSKKNVLGWIIALIIIVILGEIAAIGWSNLSKEHDEAKNLSLNAVDFSRLNDGTYIGRYDGGMYKWRESEVCVTVYSGNVTKIELTKNKENQPSEFTDKLFGAVIEKQSLQIDAISGATLTSKAYLQAVENALINAQNKN